MSSKKRNSNTASVIKRIKTKKMIDMLLNLKQFKTFYKKLKKDEKLALQDYKRAGYIEINSYLYSGNKFNDFYIGKYFMEDIKKYFSKNTVDLVDIKSINPSNIKKYVELYVNKLVVERINTIDSLFKLPDTPKLTGKEVLYRGVRENMLKSSYRVGSEVTFKNFLSTSIEQTISEFFIASYKTRIPDKLCCLYVLHNLKDVPFIYLPWEIKTASKLNKKYIWQSSHDEHEYLLPRNLKFKVIKKEYTDFLSNDNITFKTLTFEKLSRLIKMHDLDITMSKEYIKNMTAEDFQKLYDKLNRKIITIHLEYIGQEEIKPIPPFVYTSNINLHINNASGDTPKTDNI